MGSGLGTLLALASAIAVSPVPLLALIVILLSARSKIAGTGFLIGWATGIVAALVVSLSLASVVDIPRGGTSSAFGMLETFVGLVLIALGVWRGAVHAREDGPTRTPRWLRFVSSLTPLRATLVGLLMSINPKGLAVAASAGVQLSSAELAAGEAWTAGALYVAVAAAPVSLVVIGRLVTGGWIDTILDTTRTWLRTRQTLLTAAVLITLGLIILLRGILTP